MMPPVAPWYVAGPLIGLLIVGLRALLNRPFGALGGYIETIEAVTQAKRLGLPVFLTLGTVIGGAIFAVSTGTFAITFQYLRTEGAPVAASIAGQVPLLLVAGIAMGFGARAAGGCTSGHGLCGTSLGSPASLAATLTFFITAVALSLGVEWLSGGR